MSLAKVTTIILLFSMVLANPAIGSLQDDLRDEKLSMVSIFERAKQGGLSLEDTITEAIRTNPGSASTVLAAAIVIAPDSIPLIITTAARLETETEVVGIQCRPLRTSEQVVQIIVSSIERGFKPKVILEMCLPSLPAEEIADVVISALSIADESLHPGMVTAALNAMERDHENDVALLTDDLIQGLTHQKFTSSMTELDILEISSSVSTTAPSSNTESPVQLNTGGGEPPASDS